MSGILEREALENAFNHVINRHEIFRTAYWPILGSVATGINKWNTVCQSCRMNPGLFLQNVKFKQSIQPAVTMGLSYYDISGYDDEDKNIEISVIADGIIEKRYIYESPPLTRSALIRTAKSEHILIVVAAHLIADGVSMRIYEKELAHAYNALINKQSINLPDVKIQYADYAAWMKYRLESGFLDSMKSYWQRQFDGFTPTDAAILPFTDMEGSRDDPDFSIDVKYYHHPVSDELGEEIRKYAGSVNMTPFSIAMTGFILCLHYESGKNDLSILTFFANRPRPEMENIIGMFATGNMIRVKVNAYDSFHQCAASVSESINGALKNQELSVLPSDSTIYKSRYDFVVHRSIACESWVNHECVSFSGLDAERAIIARNKSEYALKSYVIESSKKLSLLFQYNLDLFDGSDIRRIAARTENIIREIITNPSAVISSLEKS